MSYDTNKEIIAKSLLNVYESEPSTIKILKWYGCDEIVVISDKIKITDSIDILRMYENVTIIHLLRPAIQNFHGILSEVFDDVSIF